MHLPELPVEPQSKPAAPVSWLTAQGRRSGRVVVLVKPEQDRNIHPLGLLYMGDALKKAGFDVRLYFLAPEDTQRIIDEIHEIDPIFVGLSVLTGVQTKIAADLSEGLKQRNPTLPIVWGGVHPTIDPQMCLNEDFIDIVVDGDGEETCIDLAKCLTNGGELNKVLGIVFMQDGKMAHTGKRPMLRDLDRYKPDWSLIDMEDHIVDYEGQRTAEFLTSRGCPFECTFCSVPTTSERLWRTHSQSFLQENLSLLRKQHDVTNVIFVDDLISTHTKRMLEILEVSRKVGMAISTCQIRLDGINKAVLDQLITSDVRRIFIGIESGSDRMLKLVKKGFNRQRILDQFKLIAQYPISVTAPLIIGYPTETWDDIRRTIDLALEMTEIIPATVVTVQTYNPYPGSELFGLALKEGFEPPKRVAEYENYDVFFASFNLDWIPWADENTLRKFHIIDGYAKMLTHDPSSNLFRTWGKRMLAELARIRLRHESFALPWEVFMMYKFNRYYRASFSEAAEWLGYNKKRAKWRYVSKRATVQTPYVDGK